jgi:hypothetical protein
VTIVVETQFHRHHATLSYIATSGQKSLIQDSPAIVGNDREHASVNAVYTVCVFVADNLIHDVSFQMFQCSTEHTSKTNASCTAIDSKAERIA